MLYEYESLEKTDIYGLMASTVVPRPIAWIVTKADEINIASSSQH